MEIQSKFTIFPLLAMHFSMTTSPRTWHQLSMLQTAVLTILFYENIVSFSKADTPKYNDFCASVVPESTTTASEFTTIPFPPNQDGYYLGGDGMFEHTNSTRYYYSSSTRKVLLFRTNHVHSTNIDNIYKVEASLIIQPSSVQNYYVEDVLYSYSYSPQVISSWSGRGALSFEVEGFWSKSTGRLCMLGSSSTHSEEGKVRVLNALLKLNNVKSESSLTSLIRGTLESLNSANDLSYFEPISILMFPLMNYTYTEVSKEVDSVCIDETDNVKSSLKLPLTKSICSIFSSWSNSFKLFYANDCDSAKNCNPFSEDVGFLPRVIFMSLIQCSNDRLSLRFLLEFPNNSDSNYDLPFSPNTTFVAEGSWNAKKNQLCVVACRILTDFSSLSSSFVKDCSIRMSLRFPSVLSIRNTSVITGHIWSNKSRNELGFFENIRFQGYKDEVLGIGGLKYKYSLIDKARKSCLEKKQQPRSKKGSQYPAATSNDMQFDMAVKNSSGKIIGYGYARPFSVGDQIQTRNGYFTSFSSSVPVKSLDKEKNQERSPLNIAYNINFPLFNASSNEQTQVEIFAEGIYDAETGVMCMVGCRYLDSNNQIPTNDVMDCEILFNIQFPLVDSNDHIQGHIKTTRKESDPWYLQPLSFSAVSFYSRHSRKLIWRMDLEIIMALISNTLVCFFVGYQILYIKKNPSMIPFISILMLVVLILGQMIPLMLNFEALFFSKQNRQSFLRSTGEWLEVNEVIVRVMTMISFLLQVRLLQLVWSARLAEGNLKASWIAAKKTLYVTLPLYIAGGLIALSVNWKDYKFNKGMNSGANSTYISSGQHSLWVDLRSYAGLSLDGFLFPQILHNIFQNSRENALSCFFYVGTTFVRLIPHGYDLYRAHYYSDDFNWSYMYANPTADYYSTSWDVIIPLGGLLFAAIIYLQQRKGGRFFLPKRFKELEGYEKLPMARDP